MMNECLFPFRCSISRPFALAPHSFFHLVSNAVEPASLIWS